LKKNLLRPELKKEIILKEIRAIIRNERLPKLREALRVIPNFPGLTMTKAEGFTAPADVVKRSVKEELTDYTPKIMVCVIVDDEMVDAIRKTIISVCTSGKFGDGLVWVVPIEGIHRIRDGTPMLDRS
jgi:nitrogen regulatory protein P-II 1